MSEFVVIGNKIGVAEVRNYLFAKKLDKGDSIVLNPTDYDNLIQEIKHSGDSVDIPVNVLGVLLVKDTSGNVPVGKVQIIQDDKM